jgi:glycosyltransferase involved in cell wall biosynthesis
MKIGVDIRVLMDKYYSGVSEYTANLLSAILGQDKLNNYKLFYNSWRDLGTRLDPWSGANSQLIGTRIPNKIFYGLEKFLAYPKIDKILGGVDVFWSPHFNFTSLSGPASGPKKVITVYDLSFLRYPEFFSWRKRLWHGAIGVKKVLRQADAIVAISENTKRDIIELVGVAPEKISVIYPGNNISRREVSEAEKQEFFQKRGLAATGGAGPGRFILFIGNIEPRKNLQGLIAAFNTLRSNSAQTDGSKFNDIKLVLAGADGWKNEEIYKAWRRSPYKDDIKFLGYISQTEKEILYSAASILAYPSFYEGFGFPPLEAMTYGLPVVCSNVSSLPEVVGDAALMVNPFRAEEIAAALQLILTDNNLRERLAAKGYARVKLFFWDKAAAEYLQLFKKVCGQ